MKKIATLGAPHSFHDVATRYLFGEKTDVHRCFSFEEIVESLDSETHKLDGAVMAIENALVGCFLPNYMLLKNHGLTIVSELILPIELALWVSPRHVGKPFDAVLSHTIALRQCSHFLSTIPNIEEHAVTDTATAVNLAAESENLVYGAIAGKEAGLDKGLVCVQENVQNRQRAWTRFLVLEKQKIAPNMAEVNKCSWFIRALDQPGVLLSILEQLQGTNIGKIQSVPDFEIEGQHGFIVDFAFSGSAEKYNELKKEVTEHAQTIQELGLYKSRNYGED
ncbi:MAG: prephenate dehydratase [Sphingobacteriales bacterium]|jgi:prephenate dehydratase